MAKNCTKNGSFAKSKAQLVQVKQITKETILWFKQNAHEFCTMYRLAQNKINFLGVQNAQAKAEGWLKIELVKHLLNKYPYDVFIEYKKRGNKYDIAIINQNLEILVELKERFQGGLNKVYTKDLKKFIRQFPANNNNVGIFIATYDKPINNMPGLINVLNNIKIHCEFCNQISCSYTSKTKAMNLYLHMFYVNI